MLISRIRRVLYDVERIKRRQDDIYALPLLQNAIGNVFLPFTPFSLNPFTLLQILNEITINDRQVIVELGSGISTIAISKFIKRQQLNATLISIDENADWMRFVKSQLEEYSCLNSCILIHAPLTKVQSPSVAKFGSSSCGCPQFLDSSLR